MFDDARTSGRHEPTDRGSRAAVNKTAALFSVRGERIILEVIVLVAQV